MKPKASRLNNQVKGIIFCPKHEPIHFAKLLLSVNSSGTFIEYLIPLVFVKPLFMYVLPPCVLDLKAGKNVFFTR